METWEATNLAGIIAQTWRGGPTANVWEDELGQMYTGPAKAAYTQLKMQEDHAPSIARFWAVYRSLHTNRGEITEVCRECDNTGMTVVEYDHQPRKHDGADNGPPQRLSYAEACKSCKTGEQRADMLRSVRQANQDARTGLA